MRLQVERLLQGSAFRAAPRQQSLLRHIVEATLAGDGDRLKGYTLGVQVFGRPPDFDPNLDPIVRVEVGRLRSKLLAHYSGEGIDDAVLIEVPKGGNAARFELRADAGAPGTWRSLHGEPLSGDRPRIAVLPFANLSGDPQQELVADGFTEDLLTELSKLSGLFVISRHATFLCKGSRDTPATIAAWLGVRYLVEGSLRSGGGRLRITARLIDAQHGQATWAERYDRPVQELFDVQDDVTRQIARALAVRLTPLEEARLAEMPTPSAEARSLVQRGIGLFWTYTEQGLKDAEVCFADAVRLDADYPAAHAWLAAAAVNRADFGFDSATTAVARGRQHVQAALAIDPLLPLAHAMQALVEGSLGSTEAAVAAGRHAIALDPNFADAHAILGIALQNCGRLSEAEAHIGIAMQLNPRPTGYFYYVQARGLRMAGRIDEAIKLHRVGLAAYPQYVWNGMGLAQCLVQQGREDEAKDVVQTLLAANPGCRLVFVNRHDDPATRERLAKAMRGLGFVELRAAAARLREEG